MAIKKQYLKSKPVCKVTFSILAEDAKKVSLVGSFNDWNEKSNAMAKLKSGDFKIDLNLTPGKEYQFRYLIDNTTWENDWEADKYAQSDLSAEENSVLVL